MTLQPEPPARWQRAVEVFIVFLALGLTSFGGPVAHLGYFHTAFVRRRHWLTEAAYADLVALCQFLPGPSSSQVGIAIGHQRAGVMGAIAAWLGFTLPSVLLLWAFSLGIGLWQGASAQGALHGLKIAALAVVAQAIWQMSLALTPDWPRRALAACVAALVLLLPLPAVPLLLLLASALLGALIGHAQHRPTIHLPSIRALLPLIVFAALLVVLPIISATTGNPIAEIADRFYRTGSLVFGGGHVVLPLLQHELVDTGRISKDVFLAGYGAAQALPGPLFAFAFYAGAQLNGAPTGWPTGLLALGAIYLPSFLLVIGTLPYWNALKQLPRLRRALDAANASVVGLLIAALINPIVPSAITAPADIAIAIAASAALLLRVPPLAVVIGCALAGWGLIAF